MYNWYYACAWNPYCVLCQQILFELKGCDCSFVYYGPDRAINVHLIFLNTIIQLAAAIFSQNINLFKLTYGMAFGRYCIRRHIWACLYLTNAIK